MGRAARRRHTAPSTLAASHADDHGPVISCSLKRLATTGWPCPESLLYAWVVNGPHARLWVECSLLRTRHGSSDLPTSVPGRKASLAFAAQAEPTALTRANDSQQTRRACDPKAPAERTRRLFCCGADAEGELVLCRPSTGGERCVAPRHTRACPVLRQRATSRRVAGARGAKSRHHWYVCMCTHVAAFVASRLHVAGHSNCPLRTAFQLCSPSLTLPYRFVSHRLTVRSALYRPGCLRGPCVGHSAACSSAGGARA